MMTESELLDRLEFYLTRLEDWKLKFPYLETFRTQLPGERDGIPNFALAQGTLLRQLEYAVSWLDQNIIQNENFSEEDIANFTYGVFDYLDLEFADSSDQRLTFLGDPPNRNFFIYPRRYWRIKNRIGPISSSSKSFETFGWCGLKANSFVIDLDSLVGDLPDQTEKMPELKIGLFPLSNSFSVVWRYSKILNADRKTHGIYASDVVSDQEEAEINTIVDCVIGAGLHMVCLPELMICPRVKEILIERLIRRYIQPRQLPFFLLVAGSCHESVGDHYRGTMPIILILHGQRVDCTYRKHEPFYDTWKNLVPLNASGKHDFEFFPGLEEMLKTTEHKDLLHQYALEDIERDTGITIVKTKGFGKFGFAVCKDVLPDQSKILKTYGSMIDHLVVVSLNYSPKADFRTIAGQLAVKKKVSTFYVNAGKYDPGGNTPTFYQLADPGRPVRSEINPGETFLTLTLDRRGYRSRRI